jgi:hypothetical protein
MMLRVFYTQFGVKGMENIGEIQYYLVPFLTQGGPSGILVLAASNRVVLLINGVTKGIPCRCYTSKLLTSIVSQVSSLQVL